MDRGRSAQGEPKIVAVGGGTGLSTMLRGLKILTQNLTAIVTVADDGGGSGILRKELGMPPPGDIRNCLLALANTEPTMQELLAHRFTEGSLKGQSFGNLFLAALNEMSDSFDEAVTKMSEVLAITGRVLPVSNEDIRLIAEFDDGSEIVGESRIFEHKTKNNCNVVRVRLSPEGPEALPKSISAIEEADMIIIGPGSLYTSIIPNLLTKGVADAISKSDAVKLCVLNIMTQEGETEGYSATDHIKALFAHSDGNLFDYCLANSQMPPEDIRRKYREKGTDLLAINEEDIRRLGVELIYAPLIDSSDGLCRHDPKVLAQEIFRIFREKSPTRHYRQPGMKG